MHAERSPRGIGVGQDFIKIDAGPGIWRVKGLFRDAQQVWHARITSAEDPETTRVVSLAALSDPRRYRWVRQP
jgi:hypothetical protein